MMTIRAKTLLSLALAISVIQTAAAEDFSCRAPKNGASHVVEISRTGKQISSFFYGAMDKSGASCDVSGKRGNADVSWVDEGSDKSVVSIKIETETIARVAIEQKQQNIKITILEATDAICGLNAYIEKSVTISPTDKKCHFN